MDFVYLALTNFVFGIITGIVSRSEKLRPISIIFGAIMLIGLLVFFGNFIGYAQNPTIEGMYDLIWVSVPFIISTAFASKGEEIVQNIANR